MDTTVFNPMSPGILEIPIDCIPTKDAEGYVNIPLGAHCDKYEELIKKRYPGFTGGSGNNKHTKRMKKKGNTRKTMKKKGNKRKTMKKKSKTFRKTRSKRQTRRSKNK
jgi:hypothetical protein